MNIFSLEEVSKNYGLKPLFSGVTLGLDESDKIGVIGANGSGKTTLLRLIAGREPADSGRVVIASEKVIAYLPQNPAFNKDDTVLDTVFAAHNETMRLLREYERACHELAATDAGNEKLLSRVAELAHQLEAIGAWELETNARNVLTQLGINDLSATMGELSGGQRKRVALAQALLSRPDLLILDEPTNHLDADTITWLETYLQRYSGALLLVTHDRYFLDRVTTRILEIDRGKVQSFAGNYAYYLEKKEEQEARREAEGIKREALIRRELAWLRRGAKARTTKQKARVERAEELMAQPKEATRTPLDISVAASRLGKKILELRDLSKAYGAQVVIQDFSYTLKRGDRIGIIGANGSGKTTLLDIIAQKVQPDTGSVAIGQTIVPGYYDQENRELNDEQRVIDYIREGAERIETADGNFLSASQMLEKFLFPPAVQYDRIGRLSGGERRRLYLLRVLMDAPNLLLLDEPTNDLDIQTLVTLEEYLENFAGCLLVASHDRYFLDRTVEHILRFEGAGRVREYPGNYSAFLEMREREAVEAAKQLPKKTAPLPSTSKSSDVPRKLTFKERRELATLEANIDQAEARKVAIEKELAANASNAELVQRRYAELQALNDQLEGDVERWSELAELA
ncbi:MAG: ABC-F family ATP-binding cassette domain-containing protein [Acidobacteria bacterium]|nr:ABC-F family ATP-binding cassette domain-containing protein [Acidobacteriota bacterium]